jgi:multisubunit Na+/H+ antiporter MnhB subunit
MVGALITLLIIALIVGLVYWVADALPVPQPMNKFVKIIAMVIGCLAVIVMLLGLAGYDTGFPVRRL